MRRFSRLALLVIVGSVGPLVGCAAGVGPNTGDDGGSPWGTSTATTEPAEPPANGGGTSTGPATSTLGTSCKAYVACCKQLATSQPQIGASCESVQTQLDAAVAKGASTTSFEASCKSGVDGFKAAGYCK